MIQGDGLQKYNFERILISDLKHFSAMFPLNKYTMKRSTIRLGTMQLEVDTVI